MKFFPSGFIILASGLLLFAGVLVSFVTTYLSTAELIRSMFVVQVFVCIDKSEAHVAIHTVS